MKPLSPTELLSEQDTFTTSSNLEEDLQTRSPSCARTTALLDEINSLAETTSVAETLELTSRLLAEVDITITHLTLDRAGFISSWRPPQALAGGAGTSTKETSFSVRAETTSLEAHYRGELNPLMKRAAGAILKAAVIQAERCTPAPGSSPSRRERNGRSRELNQRGSARGRMIEKPDSFAPTSRRRSPALHILITGETGTGKTRSAQRSPALGAKRAPPS